VIREATLADMDALVDIGRHALSGSIQDVAFGFVVDSFKEHISVLIEGKNSRVFVWDDGIIKGVVSLGIGPYIANRDKLVAVESHWFVMPQYRQSSIGIRLFEHAENWAWENGAELIMFSRPSDNARLVQFYERRGYRPVQSTYAKRRK